MLSSLIFTIKFLELSNIKIDNLIEGENLEEISECMHQIYELFDEKDNK